VCCSIYLGETYTATNRTYFYSEGDGSGMIASRNNGDNADSILPSCPSGSSGQCAKPSAPVPVTANCVQDELTRIRAARAEAQKLCLSARYELEWAKQARAAAEQYREETEARARSQAQQILLQTRLITRREIAELKRRASNEMKQLLSDVQAHLFRDAALAKREAQRKYDAAARIRSLPSEFRENSVKGSEDGKREIVGSPCSKE